MAGPAALVVAQVRAEKSTDALIDICMTWQTRQARVYTTQTRIFRAPLLRLQKNCADSTASVTIRRRRDNPEIVTRSGFAQIGPTLWFERATATSTRIHLVSQRRIRSSRRLQSCGEHPSFTRSERCDRTTDRESY